MAEQFIDEWDEEDGIFTCMIPYKSVSGAKLNGYGFAICHPEDKDMQSQYTGLEIAQSRAIIDLAQQVNAYELKPGLKALEHLLSTMDHGGYNLDSREMVRIRKEIKNYQDDIAFNKEVIRKYKAHVKEYIDNKDKLHKQLRAKQDNTK